uniref:Uncharacterized protein n=1 Tax=Rhizophora mucronata TaxID=61149 RepID=A0A2P2PR27_RHIMU
MWWRVHIFLRALSIRCFYLYATI